MALRLYGITVHDGHGEVKTADGTELLPFRELAAVVGPGDYTAPTPSGEAIDQHRAVVGSVFSTAPILPAPVGTVFRSRDTLTRWLELHYVTLNDALNFVEDREEARVHIRRMRGKADERDAGADVAAAAAESFRVLRRYAVTSVPLKTEHLTGIVLSACFLVERELWGDFVAAVEEQRLKNPGLAFDLSGPWPPYDFVRMQFGQ